MERIVPQASHHQLSLIPNFCRGQTILSLAFAMELVAIVLTLAGGSRGYVALELFVMLSLYLQWIGLCCAAALCWSRRWLIKARPGVVFFFCWGLLVLIVMVLADLAHFISRQVDWALALDGKLDRGDGLALIGLFALWQGFHLYDVRKHQLTQRQSFSPWIVFDAVLALGAAWLMLESLDWLVAWLKARPAGSLGAEHLGWVTAWLMVLPNAALAAYYAWRARADIVYASQVGDGHICIPLCLGIVAALSPFAPPAWFADAMLVLAGAAGFHALMVAVFGGLPRVLAVVPIAAYVWCLREGLS